MILTVSGTNRPGSNTRILASSVVSRLQKLGATDARLMDLANLRADIFSPTAYAEKPSWFIEEFQQPVLEASGIVVVTPEYNGSFPGVLKYFIDMLKFPESLVGIPVALIGISAGQFGALRSVEQLEMIMHYRKVHLYGERLFVPAVHQVLTPDGGVGELEPRLEAMLSGFISFSATHSSSAASVGA